MKIVKVAGKYKMPVIPYSGATSLEGHFRAVRSRLNEAQSLFKHVCLKPSVGGICVDMSRMDRIIEIHGTKIQLSLFSERGLRSWIQRRTPTSFANLASGGWT